MDSLVVQALTFFPDQTLVCCYGGFIILVIGLLLWTIWQERQKERP